MEATKNNNSLMLFLEPDEQGTATNMQYEEELHNDLKSIPEAERERYLENYRKYFSAMLASHANLNHRRNEKAKRSYDNRLNEFRTWRDRALAAISRKMKDTKPQKQRQEEAWQQLLAIISRSAATIHAINIGKCEGYNKALFVDNTRNRVSTYARNGEVEIVDKAIEYIREQNKKGQKAIITEQNSFFKLPQIARAQRAKLEELSVKENKEIPFDGGKIILNYQEDRLQICLDSMPSDELRHTLKREYSFNWSAKNKAWQRRLTNNTWRDARKALNLTDTSYDIYSI